VKRRLILHATFHILATVVATLAALAVLLLAATLWIGPRG
jgi:hypothetical protein